MIYYHLQLPLIVKLRLFLRFLAKAGILSTHQLIHVSFLMEELSLCYSLFWWDLNFFLKGFYSECIEICFVKHGQTTFEKAYIDALTWHFEIQKVINKPFHILAEFSSCIDMIFTSHLKLSKEIQSRKVSSPKLSPSNKKHKI